MKRFGAMMVGATSLAAVLLLAPLSAQAQDGAAPGGQQGRGQGRGFGGGQFGRGGMMGGPATLASLPLPALEKGLGLTPEQKTKIEGIQTKAQEEMRASFTGFGGGQRPSPEEMQALRTKMQEQQKKTSDLIQAELTDEQKGKVKDFLADATVFQSAQLPLELISDLKLTPEQKTKLAEATKKIQADQRQKMADAQGDFQAFRGIMQESQTATRAAVDTTLTADQKAMVAKWEKEHPRRGFGGPGGGGRRNGNGNGAPPQQP